MSEEISIGNAKLNGSSSNLHELFIIKCFMIEICIITCVVHIQFQYVFMFSIAIS